MVACLAVYPAQSHRADRRAVFGESGACPWDGVAGRRTRIYEPLSSFVTVNIPSTRSAANLMTSPGFTFESIGRRIHEEGALTGRYLKNLSSFDGAQCVIDLRHQGRYGRIGVAGSVNHYEPEFECLQVLLVPDVRVHRYNGVKLLLRGTKKLAV